MIIDQLRKMEFVRLTLILVAVVIIGSQGPWGDWVMVESWRLPVIVGLVVMLDSLFRHFKANRKANEQNSDKQELL